MPKRARSKSTSKYYRKKARARSETSWSSWSNARQSTGRLKKNIRTGWEVVARTRPYVPDKTYTKVVYYASGHTIDPGVSGAAVSYDYGANCLYDPNITGVGHQPTGFDQMMAFYNKYYVTRCKAIVAFRGTDATYNTTVGLYVSRGSFPTDLVEIIENGNGSNGLLLPASSTYSNGCTAVLSVDIDVPKEFGVTKTNYLNQLDMAGTVSSNPANILYLYLWAGQPQAVDVSLVSIDYIRLEYTVCFKEIKSLAIS